MDRFGPATRAWFESVFARPTDVQERGWPAIASGENALLIAPTGSGKTLAAFLWCIDRLSRQLPRQLASRGERSTGTESGVRVVYVSPLKALVYDIERNLRAPLAGIEQAGRQLNVAPESTSAAIALPRVAIRTGDTTARERRRQAKYPAEILVTTPESLYLILGSQARETLRTVETIIVDEVHSLAPTKRGAHLALSLERLSRLAAKDARFPQGVERSERGTRAAKIDPQRIGLSATARPLAEVARFLGGDRPVTIVDAGKEPSLDLQIVVPAEDMTRPTETAVLPSSLESREAEAGLEEARGMWPTIYPHLLALIRDHKSTIIFVNSRALCERLCHRLNELAGPNPAGGDLVRSHHGSLSHSERRQVEEALQSGQLACIVATSSLELGIDMEAVDLVILVESPGSVARGLQRIGRAGHGVGQVSKGRLFPKHRGDLLEAAVVARSMTRAEIESLTVPQNPLDVLAQQIVAMVAAVPADTWSVDDLAGVVRRAANFRDLPDSAFRGVLDMLAGRYPSSAFADLIPRVVWDRQRGTLSSRRGAKMVALVNGGTIPDRGLYGVYYGDVRVGELDEEMVQETQPGELFTLGATTWRVDGITRDRVLVVPAPGQAGKLPFWRGDGPGRPVELGRAVGAFVRELGDRLALGDARARENGRETQTIDGTGDGDPAVPAETRAEVEAWLAGEFRLDAMAARNLVDYVWQELLVTGFVPSDRRVVIERFPDELGDDRVCVLSPLGARVHAPWALALQARLSAITGYEIKTLWSDDGIVLRVGGGRSSGDPHRRSALGASGLPAWQLRDALSPEPEELRELITGALASSALFAGQFRENASRALLMPRRRPGQRTPLWVQRLKSQELLAVAREYASFPVVIETYRSCMQDVFDLDALEDVLGAIRSGDVAVEVVDTPVASPFARSLVFAYVAAFLYEGDAPLAERKVQALTLDRALLRELLGSDDLSELLDADAMAEVEAMLQRLPLSQSDAELGAEHESGFEYDHRARHADAVHDLLRRLGDLTTSEIGSRSAGDAEAMLAELERSNRAVVMAMGPGGESRWVAIEDVALYRDALGAAAADDVMAGIPANLLAPVPGAAEALVERYARTHGPFEIGDLARRYGLAPGQAEAILRALHSRGEIVPGSFRPGDGEGASESEGESPKSSSASAQWCHPDVLRRIKRRTLSKLRGRVAPVPAAQLGRFLPGWHGIGRSGVSLSSASLPRSRTGSLTRLQEAIVQLEGLPLPYRELEQVLLPARVADFSPRQLDELGAMGWLVWIGCGALGVRDGKVALYRRDRVAALHAPPQPAGELDDVGDLDDMGDLHRAILAHLETQGASFFAAIGSACAPAATDEVVAALWDLVWAGKITNDTLQPVRALGSAPRPKSPKAAVDSGRQAPPQRARSWRDRSSRSVRRSIRGGVSRRVAGDARAATSSIGGRWSLVAELVAGAPSATERAHARAVKLLERHGIVTREAAALENLPGGFSAIYPVFRAMEEAGKVRRGYFVAGLGGAQFAFAGAVDKLRAAGSADRRAAQGALVLSAVDPANPYGWLLPWPESPGAGDGPGGSPARRLPGASVVLVAGEPVLYLDASGRRAVTFAGADDRDALTTAVRALDRIAAQKKGKTLRIESIDGEPARASPRAEAFLAAGYYTDPRGLVRELQLFETS